jgi:RNA polymerase-binding transcription factor
VDPERARELLGAERERIVRALARLGHADTGELSSQEDPASLASDTYQDERAEKRLADGTYGLSVVSGVPIPDERLEAIPTAERTVEEES